jgi:hypothetical protein
MLLVAAGAAVFRALTGSPTLTGQITDRRLLAIALAGMAMYVANKLLVFAIVSVQHRRLDPGALRQLVQVNAAEEAVLLLLGVLATMAAAPSPWLAVLPLAATLLVLRELVSIRRRQATAEEQRDFSRAATSALAYRAPTTLIAGF